MLPVLLVGGTVELVLLFGLVRPFWLFGPREAIITPEPAATLLGISTGGMLRFAGTFALWLAGYAAALALSRRPLTRPARRLLAGFPLLFACTLLFVLPVSSKDVYHYLMEGRVLAVHGDNPMTVPPAAYPDDALAWTLSSWQETPSRYGPVFVLAAGGIARIAGDSLAAGLLAHKLLAVAALLGAAALAWRTAGGVRPQAAMPAFVLVAWNPLALYEAGANAHNDLLMVFFTALALYVAARRRWELAFPALALGALTKYVVVVLGPLFLLACILSGRAAQGETRGRARQRRTPIRFGTPRWSAPAGIAGAVALTVALYAPFWDGPHTFDALRSASGGMLSSPGWLLRQALKHVLGWEGARPVVAAALTGVFLVGYARVLRSLRRDTANAPHDIDPSDAVLRLSRAALVVLILELCTLSWWLWPWYALWLLPPAALLAGRRAATLVAVVTGAALLAYVPLNFRELFWGPATTDRMSLAVVLVMFLPPAAALGALTLRDAVSAHRRPLSRQGRGEGGRR